MLELDINKGLATIASNIGTEFYKMGNSLQSRAYLLKGLRLAENLYDELAMSRMLNNLDNLYVVD